MDAEHVTSKGVAAKVLGLLRTVVEGREVGRKAGWEGWDGRGGCG